MGIFGWLFGKTVEQKVHRASPATVETPRKAGRSLPAVKKFSLQNFIGQTSRSPKGRYTVAWRDSNDAGTQGGHRESGHGRYYLFDGDQLAAEGKMERPNDGRVADNGTFVLSDWKFGSGLNGTFFAFRADGTTILSRDFQANIYNSGLSPDGRMAACQTCNSDSEEDSSILAIFDLSSGTEIAAWPPESGWANSYEFREGEKSIRLGYRDKGSFTYSLDGDFLDRERWVAISLEKGNLYLVEGLLKEHKDALSEELAEKLLASIERTLSATPGDDRTNAYGLKLRGLCLDRRGALSEALKCFEQAIRLDPKIGVKRRAAEIRKALGST